MLQEGHRRKARGTDVVVGIVEPHGRPEIRALIGDLEVVPPRTVEHAGKVLREMDTDAVLLRHPQTVLVDELAHTNAPGSKHRRSFEDIQELLDAGITVVTTLNVASIESLTDSVQQTTGIPVEETLPDSVVDGADQVELIDLPPEDLIERLEDGKIYPNGPPDRMVEQLFTAGNLTALRDMALRVTAREVEEKMDSYWRDMLVEGSAPVGERIMVAVDHRPAGKTLIRRGWRVAAALKGEFVVVHVESSDGRRKPKSADEERQLGANLQLAEDLGAEVVHLQGKVADELLIYARASHISHLFIGHPSHRRWDELLRGSVTSDILRKASDISVHVIGEKKAGQIELIDMDLQVLIRRMIHGNIYPPEQAKRALENFFALGNLTALRDLALRATAREVEDKLTLYMRDSDVEEEGGTREKVMVAIDHRPNAGSLIREGWRMSAALRGDLVVVYVEPTDGRGQAKSVEDERELRSALQLANELGARVVRLRGKVAQDLIDYARANSVTQLVMGAPTHNRWEELMHGSVTKDVLRAMPGLDVHVVPTRTSRVRREDQGDVDA